MVVAGIAAIRLDLIDQYWGVLTLLGVVGMGITYAYNRLVVNVLFRAQIFSKRKMKTQ